MLTVPFSNNTATTLILGYNATIQCVDIAEAFVNWTNSSGAIISNNNTLIISKVKPSHNTNLTCTAVLNVNPSNCLPERETITVDIKGINKIIDTLHIPNFPSLVPNIIITGNYTGLTVGSAISIYCETIPSVRNGVIKWQSSSFNSDSNELIINPVMLSHNNKTFTCVVSSDLLIQPLTKNITLIVLSQLLQY